TQLALQLSFDLLDRQALRAHFTHAPEKSERLKIVSEVSAVADRRAVNDSGFGPAPHRAVAQPKELFDFTNRVTGFDALVVRLGRNGGRKRENLSNFFGHARATSLHENRTIWESDF